MMNLELVKEMHKEGTTYQLFKIGSYEVEVTIYENGNKNIYVSKDYNERYLTEIYYHEDFYGRHEPRFEIQTTSYGALKPEEIKEVIAGYEAALEVVEVLTKEFIEKDEEAAMLERLEEARAWSETHGRVWAYGNGHEIIFTDEESEFSGNGEDLRNRGYWVVSIFEHGHRAEA